MQRKIQVTEIAELLSHPNGYDSIIDVRSPSEFHEDHIPGAINLPVLSDQERAEVGTIYKQVDPFTARKTGAVLTSQNIAQHISTLSNHGRDWKPLVYCWRGGQRSGSLALVMHEIGWSVTLLQGGYKAYRRHVQQELNHLLPQLRFIVVAGPTGCGKTDLLRQLQSQGCQVLDLESLANHRGSLLGREPGSCQPSQKWFESSLYHELCQLDLEKPIYVESESSKIGEIHLPTALFKNLITSSAVVLSCDRSKRAQYLVRRYQHLTQSIEDTTQLVERLAFRHGKQQITEWVSYINTHNWLALATSLLEHHYDPAYERSQTRLRVAERCELQCPGELTDHSVFERIDA